MEIAGTKTIDTFRQQMESLWNEHKTQVTQKYEEQQQEMEQDLDNFRNKAHTLQVAWAQESPYVHEDEENPASYSSQPPIVEADTQHNILRQMDEHTVPSADGGVHTGQPPARSASRWHNVDPTTFSQIPPQPPRSNDPSHLHSEQSACK